MARARPSRVRGNNFLATATDLGLVDYLLGAWSMARFLLALLFVTLAGLYLWDKVATESTLDPSQYELTIDPIQRESLPGYFKLDVGIVNNSEALMERIVIEADLYDCETLGQPITSCDFQGSRHKEIMVNIPAGRRGRTNSSLDFVTNSEGRGIGRVEIRVVKVVGDFDRDR